MHRIVHPIHLGKLKLDGKYSKKAGKYDSMTGKMDYIRPQNPGMLRRWFSTLSGQKKMVVLLVLVLVALGVLKSGYYTIRYGGPDLRVRVVGARLVGTSASPYFYKWHTGDPGQLADPNDRPDRSVNGLSVAPGVLYVQRLFTWLDYPALRMAWTVFLYLLAFCMFGFMLGGRVNSPTANMYMVAIGGLFFLCSQIWFYNIERGQVYLLYGFFFWLVYQLYTLQKPVALFLSGVVLAIAIYCRPTMAVVAIPFVAALSRPMLVGLAAGGMSLLRDAYMHRALWNDYFSAMAWYTLPDRKALAAGAYVQPVYPAIIEEAGNLTHYKTDFTVGGIRPLDTIVQKFWQGPHTALYIGLYGMIVLVIGICWWKKWRQGAPALLILSGFLLYIISEYLVPAPRGGYNMVQWMFPVLLLLQKEWLTDTKIVLLVVGLCLIVSFPFPFPWFRNAGEALLLYCLICGIRSEGTKTAGNAG
jgi:hypothetical protein